MFFFLTHPHYDDVVRRLIKYEVAQKSHLHIPGRSLTEFFDSRIHDVAGSKEDCQNEKNKKAMIKHPAKNICKSIGYQPCALKSTL